MSRLELPVVIWSEPPTHEVTNLIVAPDGKHFVTGSRAGDICIWSFSNLSSDQDKIKPKILIVGQQSSVVTFTTGNYYWKDVVVSATADGTLSVWDCVDGVCLASARSLIDFHPTKLVTLTDRQYIACCGRTNEIVIIDIWKLEIICTVSAHTSWIADLCSINIGKNYNPVLISLSTDSTLRFSSFLKSDQEHHIHTLQLPATTPSGERRTFHGVTLSPSLKLLLVISSDCLTLYSANDMKCLQNIKCPYDLGWKSAIFIDDSKLLALSDQARYYQYELPTYFAKLEALHLKFTSTPPTNPSDVTSPRTVRAKGSPSLARSPIQSPQSSQSMIPGSPSWKLQSNTSEVLTKNTLSATPDVQMSPVADDGGLNRPTLRFVFKKDKSDTDNSFYNTSPQPISYFKEMIFSPSVTGSIDVWKIPEKYDASKSIKKIKSSSTSDSDSILYPEEEAEKEKEEFNFEKIKVFSTCKLGDSWPKNSPLRSSCTSMANSDNSTITASSIIEETLTLARGYSNGDLMLIKLPADSSPRKINKAHHSKINCILSIRPSPSSQHFLITGSDDCAIKVWNLKTLDLLQTWNYHTASITHLVKHPNAMKSQYSSNNQNAEKDKDTFFSISKDKTVSMFSLNDLRWKKSFSGHPAMIDSIGWNIHQNYLIVSCVDGSVSVWEMISGVLESCVNGRIARTIKDTTTFYGSYGNISDDLVSSKAVKGFTIKNGRTPIQILELDIKLLLRNLYAWSKKNFQPKKSNYLHQPHSLSSPISPSSTSTSHSHSDTHSHSSSTSTSHSTTTTTTTIKKKSLHKTIAYLFLSYLIPWNASVSLDQICSEELKLMKPDPAVHLGIRYSSSFSPLQNGSSSHGRLLSLVLPTQEDTEGLSRFSLSPFLTGVQLLGIVSYAKALLSLSDNKNPPSQLMSFFCAILPELLQEQYLPPSLPFVSDFWFDPIDDVKQAARAIFASTIRRMSPEELKIVASSWAIRLRSKAGDADASAIVLALLEAEKPDSLEPGLASDVVRGLLNILRKKKPDNGSATPLNTSASANSNPSSTDKEKPTTTSSIVATGSNITSSDNQTPAHYVNAAAELLGKGFTSWKHHVKDIKSVIQDLFFLSLSTDTPNPASHSLLLIASLEPRNTIDSLAELIFRTDLRPSQRADGVMFLGELVKKNALSFMPQLPRLVDTVVKSLDPNVPNRRESCLRSATPVVHRLVKSYPMVSFHQQTQRLAVGAGENIVIYDLKSASKWHVIEEHNGPVTAVSFSAEGSTLAVYIIEKEILNFYNTTSGLFGVFGSGPKKIRSVSVPNERADPRGLSNAAILEGVKLRWLDAHNVQLHNGGGGSVTLRLG